jgi:hypothetical protein
MIHCLSIDPGKTTGVCTFGFDHLAKSIEDAFHPVECLEIAWEDRFYMLEKLIMGRGMYAELKPQIIVFENFRLRQGRAFEQSGSDFPSSQVIGIVGAYAALMIPNPILVSQEPAAMTRVAVREEHLKLITGSLHKIDAYKHARYYTIMNHVSMVV